MIEFIRHIGKLWKGGLTRREKKMSILTVMFFIMSVQSTIALRMYDADQADERESIMYSITRLNDLQTKQMMLEHLYDDLMEKKDKNPESTMYDDKIARVDYMIVRNSEALDRTSKKLSELSIK